jgi:cell division inhibitor SepF
MAFRDTWHRTLVYFGLAEDRDAYDDEELEDPREPEEELESEAPADAVATEGPSAVEVLSAEGESEFGLQHPQEAPPEKESIPVEPLDEEAEGAA